MYTFMPEYVHMSDLTITEMRKTLFQIIDQMIDTGEPVRVRRRGVTVELAPRLVGGRSHDPTPEERWARFLTKPERKTSKSADFEALENGPHWEWRIPVDLA